MQDERSGYVRYLHILDVVMMPRCRYLICHSTCVDSTVG